MSWDALGALAELVRALGVIAPLVHLGMQVRERRQASSSGQWIYTCLRIALLSRSGQTSMGEMM